jgi:hypothetical protein
VQDVEGALRLLRDVLRGVTRERGEQVGSPRLQRRSAQQRGERRRKRRDLLRLRPVDSHEEARGATHLVSRQPRLGGDLLALHVRVAQEREQPIGVDRRHRGAM